jgi:hypothetical protein
MTVAGVLIASGAIPNSFLLCSSFSFGVTLEENYGAAGSERDRPNGPIGMPILRVWGLWAYAANEKETKERRYPESKFQRRPCSKASRVAAARWGENFSGSWSVTSRNPLIHNGATNATW